MTAVDRDDERDGQAVWTAEDEQHALAYGLVALAGAAALVVVAVVLGG